MLNFDSTHRRVLFFVFSVCTACGMVFSGVLSAFSFMLSESGFSTSQIATVFLASCPYSFKFSISPFIKNILYKYRNSKINIFKTIAFISQFMIIAGLTCLGFFNSESSLLIIFIAVFLMVLSGSIHDILADYLRILCFSKKTLGIATSIGTIGFRIGMLLSGAGILYIASYKGWKIAFFSISLVTLLSSISTILLPSKNIVHFEKETIHISSVKSYLSFCKDIFKKYSVFIIILITFSFKFSDSSINSLKSVFLQSMGIGKIDFANISQIAGSLIIILSGSIAGLFTYKFGTKKCVKLSFYCQIMASVCYLILSLTKNNLLETAVFINIATFFFGFSAVVYRTYISEISMGDINKYTIFLSIGSVGRTLSSYYGGLTASFFSWPLLFLMCIISNIPGLYASSLSPKNKKIS